MSMWWLQPGWKSAVCSCGRNIWQSGGDPDWGECFECKVARHSREEQEQEIEPEPPYPRCDICGTGDAVTGVAGFGVCSEECANEAKRRKSACEEADA